MKKLAILILILLGAGGSLRAQTQVPIIAGVATADVGQSTKFKITVNAAVQLVLGSSTTPAPYPGETVNVVFTENATGGFAVTFAANIGSGCTVNTAANATTQCSFTYDATANTWNAGGSSGGGPGIGNAIDVTQAPYSVPTNVVISGGDGSTINLQPTFSSTNQNCAAAQATYLAVVVNTANGSYPYGTGLVTVLSCNGNSWTLSANATATVSSAAFAIGPDVTTPLQTAHATGQNLILPCDSFIVTAPPFTNVANANFFTNDPSIRGCPAGSTRFILHPQIASALTTGGAIFASYPAAVFKTGSYGVGGIVQGLGNQGTFSNIFITSLKGIIPATASQVYQLVTGFAVVDNVVVQVVGLPTNVTSLTYISVPGESRVHNTNLQNSIGIAPVGVSHGGGQGPAIISDSIIAFLSGVSGTGSAANCGGSGPCFYINDYFTGNNNGVIMFGSPIAQPGIVFENVQCGSSGGGGTWGCIGDNGNAVTVAAFASSLSGANANVPALRCTNANTIFDVSVTSLISNTAGWNVQGSCTFNDRVGNSFSSPLTQFTGMYVPIGGGSKAISCVGSTLAVCPAATNFGTVITNFNIVASAPRDAIYDIKIGFKQVTPGVTCTTNSTVQGTLSWTAGGISQSATLNTLTVVNNGAVGTMSTYQSIPVNPDIGTNIQVTTTTALGTCGTPPQYRLEFSNI